MLTNVLGTRNLLRLAEASGARFLQASTSEVYGDPQVHPQPEGYWGHVNSVGPRSCYDEAKRFAEAMTMAYHRARGVDTRIVRIFNTYGPRMRPNDGRIVPTLINQALGGEPLTVFGDGSQTRSFCYVDDLVEAIVRAGRSNVAGPVNIADDDPAHAPELAGLLEPGLADRRLADVGAGREPDREDDLPARLPDEAIGEVGQDRQERDQRLLERVLLGVVERSLEHLAADALDGRQTPRSAASARGCVGHRPVSETR